jgi:hypothetical protein
MAKIDITLLHHLPSPTKVAQFRAILVIAKEAKGTEPRPEESVVYIIKSYLERGTRSYSFKSPHIANAILACKYDYNEDQGDYFLLRDLQRILRSFTIHTY